MLLEEIMDEPQQTSRLGEDEFRLAYDKLFRHEMTKEEISTWSREVAEEGRYTRTFQSLEFVMNRMHILLHGIAPEGESPTRAGTMFKISQPMVNYVIERGDFDHEDISAHVEHAKEELAERPLPRPRMKPEEARKIMSDYYQANKNNIPRTVTTHRESIIQDILNGLSAEEAFDRHT